MKKQNVYLVAGAAAFLGILLATTLTARSSAAGDHGDGDGEIRGHGFSDKTIKGWWGFSNEQSTLLTPAGPVPMVGVGRIYFDGNGGCSVSNVINLNGESAPYQSSSCTYSVNADGMGTSEAVFPGAPITDPFPVTFVITDHAREIRAINTKFIVGSFTARRQ